MSSCEEVDQPYEGQKFKSFDALKKYLEEYGQKNYVKFWIRSSHTKNSLKSKTSKAMNPDLKYVCIKFACIFGGEKIRCRGSGMRKCSTYRNLGCPCKINAVVGEDGNHLKLNTVILEHNHVLCKTLYDSLKKTKKKTWTIENNKQFFEKDSLLNCEDIKNSNDNNIGFFPQNNTNKKEAIISVQASGNYDQDAEEEKKNEISKNCDSTKSYLQSIKEKYGRNFKILVVNSQNVEDTYLKDVNVMECNKEIDTHCANKNSTENLDEMDFLDDSCNDICRLCLSSKEKLLPIFNPDLPVKSTILSFKIMGCASIEVNCDDGLPNNICTTCEANLDIAYNFRIRCENSDSILRKAYLKKEILRTKENFVLKNTKDSEDAVYKENFASINYQVSADDEINVKESNETARQDFLSNQTIVNCPLCNVESETYEKMLEHLNSHLNEESFLPCNVCNEVCPTVKELQEHLRLHINEVKSASDSFSLSDKIFPIDEVQVQEEAYSVTNHQVVKKPSETHYLCNVCGKILKTKDRFRSHKNTHDGLRPHICLKCGRGFADRRNMHHHYNVMHLRKPKLECPVCKKKFYTRTKMKSHITMHYGVKPFSCDVCNKTFRLKMNMIKHKKTHSNDRPHKCDKCSAAFIDKNMLKRHSYIHGGIRPHPCPVCGHRFSVKFHLKKHLEKSKCRVGAVVMSEDFQWMNIEQSKNNIMEKECVMIYKNNDENSLEEGIEAITMDILQEYQGTN